jgi:hypothetical protein
VGSQQKKSKQPEKIQGLFVFGLFCAIESLRESKAYEKTNRKTSKTTPSKQKSPGWPTTLLKEGDVGGVPRRKRVPQKRPPQN